MNTLRIWSHAWILASASVLVMLIDGTEASSRILLKEDAIKVANKEVEKLGIDLQELEIDVDRGNRKWDYYMSILKESGIPESRQRYQQYQARLQGRTFWTLFYHLKHADSHGARDGGVTVLIDARSGEVLIVSW
ncbi:MAG: hypothetical protein ABTQ25_16705 [Nitrosomonas ureae]